MLELDLNQLDKPFTVKIGWPSSLTLCASVPKMEQGEWVRVSRDGELVYSGRVFSSNTNRLMLIDTTARFHGD